PGVDLFLLREDGGVPGRPIRRGTPPQAESEWRSPRGEEEPTKGPSSPSTGASEGRRAFLRVRHGASVALTPWLIMPRWIAGRAVLSRLCVTRDGVPSATAPSLARGRTWLMEPNRRAAAACHCRLR